MADGGVRRDIPIKLGDFSVIDNDFSNIRDRFDAEMKKMEEEMTKFRSELMNRESNFFRTTTSSSTSSNSVTSGGGGAPNVSDRGSWLEGINSPLIQQDGDNKMLKLRFDVSQYKPEEIVVKTVDNMLHVHAKHEEKTDSKSVFREYNREFALPQGTNPEWIRSSLSKDGVLTVEAPLPALANHPTMVPITHQ